MLLGYVGGYLPLTPASTRREFHKFYFPIAFSVNVLALDAL